jgi:hypothetical protein
MTSDRTLEASRKGSKCHLPGFCYDNLPGVVVGVVQTLLGLV